MNRGEAGGKGGFHRWEADFEEMPDLMEMGTGSQAVVEWSVMAGMVKRSWGRGLGPGFGSPGTRRGDSEVIHRLQFWLRH